MHRDAAEVLHGFSVSLPFEKEDNYTLVGSVSSESRWGFGRRI